MKISIYLHLNIVYCEAYIFYLLMYLLFKQSWSFLRNLFLQKCILVIVFTKRVKGYFLILILTNLNIQNINSLNANSCVNPLSFLKRHK